MISILLADQEPIYLNGLVSSVAGRFTVVGVTRDGQTLVRLHRRFLPDVTVASIDLTSLNGVAAALQIRTQNPGARFVILATSTDNADISATFEPATTVYLCRGTCTAERLREAIAECNRGKTSASGRGRCTARDNVRNTKPLTVRQTQVLDLIAEGRTTKEIAGALNVSIRTARFHRYEIMSRLGVRTGGELVAIAVTQRLLDSERTCHL